MSEGWQIVSPAPRTAALELAGPFSRMRARVMAQVRTADSVAIYLNDKPLAVAMFARHGWRRVEMALAISPDAAPHMRRLIRIAQLTLPAMAETCLIVAHIRPANKVGQKMATMTGFRRARVKHPAIWIFERKP